MRIVPRPEVTAPLPVTVYVPARDEAEVIESSIRALLTEPVARVVVIDDGSTDDTSSILARLAAEDSRLAILSGRGPLPGEVGKPAALAHAVETEPPQTPWVLFVDADVVVARGAVAGLLEAAKSGRASLVTIIPEVTLKTPVEALVMPPIGALILAHHPPARVADPADPLAFANGQMLLVERERYLAVEGHASVRREVLEDVRLAERMKAAGARLLLADGQALARTRMYASWAELFEGLTKNVFLLVGGTWPRVLRAALLTLALGAAPVFALSLSPDLAGLAGYLLILAMQMTLRRSARASAAWAVLAPLGAVLAAWVLLASARRFHRGEVM